MSDLLDIGTAALDAKTNVLLVQAKTTRIGEDADDAPDIGEAPIACALGVTAFPAPANENGHAQGVKTELPGTTGGWITAARDTRVADVVAQLAAGETCLHSTGEGFDSRVFCKKQLLALIVGDDMAVVVDRKNKKITLSAFGGHFEISESDGVYMAHEGAMARVKDGMFQALGQVVLGGSNPIAPMAMIVNGLPVPAPGVFYGGG